MPEQPPKQEPPAPRDPFTPFKWGYPPAVKPKSGTELPTPSVPLAQKTYPKEPTASEKPAWMSQKDKEIAYWAAILRAATFMAGHPQKDKIDYTKEGLVTLACYLIAQSPKQPELPQA